MVAPVFRLRSDGRPAMGAVLRLLLLLLPLACVVRAQALDEYRTCPGRTLIANETRGRISIVRKGQRHASRVTCEWMIEAPADRPFITLEAVQFASECSFDFVYLFDGCSAEKARKIAVLSGDLESLNSRVFVGRDCLLVHFVSDLDYTRWGFTFDFRIGACPANCPSGRCNTTTGACLCEAGRRGRHCQYSVAETCPGPQNRWADGECVCKPGWAGFNCSLALAPGSGPSLSGVWHSLRTPDSARVFSKRAYTAAAVTDSALFVFGGRDLHSSLADLLRLPLPNASSWEVMRPTSGSAFPSARHGHAMWVAGGRLFVYGGADLASGRVFDELWRFSPADGAWTQLGLPPGAPALVFHTATPAGNSVFLVGGQTETGGINKAMFRLTVDPVTVLMVRPRFGVPPAFTGHSTIFHPPNQLVVYGGFENVHHGLLALRSSRVHVYSLNTSVWSTMSHTHNLPDKRAFHSATRVGNYMVVAGGSVHRRVVNKEVCKAGANGSLHYYDLTCHRWLNESEVGKGLPAHPPGDLPPGRFGHSAVVLRGHVLLLLGGFAGQMLDRLDAYVLPSFVARAQDSTLSMAEHCASLPKCTVDRACAVCRSGTTERCVPVASVANPSSCTTAPACDGPCPLLPACVDCLGHGFSCSWCSQHARCQSRTATSCSITTPLSWWKTPQIVTELSSCRTAQPPAGIFASYHLPPVNTSLPDQVMFVNSLSPAVIYYVDPWPPNFTDPNTVAGKAECLLHGTITPLLPNYHAMWPFQLQAQLNSPRGYDVNISLSSDETASHLRLMTKEILKPVSHMRFGRSNPFPSGTKAFYLMRIAVQYDYTKPFRQSKKDAVGTISLKWMYTNSSLEIVTSAYLRPRIDAAECPALPSCLACVTNVACGWCRSARVCQTRAGNAHCVSPMEEVITTADQCSVCKDHKQCDDCTLDPNCEWYRPATSCVRRGRFNESLTRREQCPPKCTALTNCSACFEQRDCVWCDTSSQCYPFAWQVWNLVGDCAAWRYRESCRPQCNASSCAACVGQLGCGWCHDPDQPHIGTCSSTACPANRTRAYYECPAINECELGLDSKCKPNSTCVDVRHGYRCQCDPGFEGDGEVKCERTCYPACIHGRCSGSPDYTCICDLGFTGRNCSEDCGCNRHANCSAGPGHCDTCYNGTTGDHCERCLLGHYGNASHPAGCAPCSCHGHGIPPQLCHPLTGDCRCQHNTQGRDCSSCLPGHHGTPTIDAQPCYATCEGRQLMTNLSSGHTGYIGWQLNTGSILHCHWLIDARVSAAPVEASSTPVPGSTATTTTAPVGDTLIVVQFTSIRRLPCDRGGVYFHDRGGNVSMALPRERSQAADVGLLGVACDRVLDTGIESHSGFLGVYFLYEKRASDSGYPAFAFNFTVLRCPACGMNRTCQDGRCRCPPGRTGLHCQREICPGNCSGANGVCQANGCRCAPKWSGNDCSRLLEDLTGPAVSMVTDETPARFGHSLVTCGGQMLLFGGETPDGLASDHLYRFAEKAWTRLNCSGLCPPPMSWHAAACDNVSDSATDPAMLVLGPTGGALWRYQVRAAQWSSRALPSPLSGGAVGHSLTLLKDGRLAMVGGFVRAATDRSWVWNEEVWLFNRSGEASPLRVTGQLPAGVFGHSAATSQEEMPDLLFIVAGFHASRTSVESVSGFPPVLSPEPLVSNDVFALQLSTGKWHLMPAARVVGTPPPAHAFAAAVKVGHSQLLVHGGVGKDGRPLADGTLRVYDLFCNVWSEANIDWRSTDPLVRNFSMVFGAGLAPTGASRFLLVGGALAGTVSRLSLAIEQLSGTGGLSLRCLTCQCAPAEKQVQDCAVQKTCRHCRAASVLPRPQYGVSTRECVWCGTCHEPKCRNGTSCGAECTFSITGTGAKCLGEESCGDTSTCVGCRDLYPKCEWSRQHDQCGFVLTSSLPASGKRLSKPTCLAEGCRPGQECGACVQESAPCAFAAGQLRCLKQTVLPLVCAGGRCGSVFQERCPNINNCSGLSICARCLAVPGCGWVASNPDSQDGQGRCLMGGYGGPYQCPADAAKSGCGKSSKHWAFAECPLENECENGHHTCDNEVEKCVDKPQGFDCVCRAGYERVDEKCKPKCEQGCVEGTCVLPNKCKCKFGFVKDDCSVKCDCNGFSDCKGPGREERKECLNCTQNTKGKQCQYCLPQFVGDPTKGISCTPCRDFCHSHSDLCVDRVDLKTAETSGATSLSRGPTREDATCVLCSNWTTGNRCEKCREGYFRLSNLARDACRPCQCNGHSWMCDASTGSGCKCMNNTRSDEKCSKLDTVRTTPTLKLNCYRNQCSSCKEYFLGKPIKGRQCYMRMSMERKYCFDLFHSQAQCGLKPQYPLPLGKAVFYVVQPKYMNVDIRVIVDMLEGEVDVYISSDNQRFVVTNDPTTWQHRVSIEPPLTPSSGSTLARRRRDAPASDVREVLASPIVTHVRLEPGTGVLLVRRVSRRLIVFVSRSEHNLKSHRFYLIFRGAAVNGAQALVVFRQDQVHIDLFVFFSVFFACFFLLLGAFIVGWKCKQVMDFRRSMEREARARQTMASRPFARVYVALDRRPLLLSRGEGDAGGRLPPIVAPRREPPEFCPVPVAVEPTDDGIACVGTLLIQVPGPVLALGSGLMTMRVMYPSGKQAGVGGLRRRVSVSAC